MAAGEVPEWAEALGVVRGADRGLAAASVVRGVAAWARADNAYVHPAGIQFPISVVSPAQSRNALSAVRP